MLTHLQQAGHGGSLDSDCTLSFGQGGRFIYPPTPADSGGARQRTHDRIHSYGRCWASCKGVEEVPPPSVDSRGSF